MSVLSTSAITERLKEVDLTKRLVVSPLLEEGQQARTGQAAVDVRLGFHFCLVTASRFGTIDEFQGSLGQPSFRALYRREFIPLGGNIVIHPHQFVLAQTLEYIRLPADLMAFVIGRSTWGRLGLIVATAVGIHPGFAGNLTLELRNLGETPLTLFPGQTIGQLFLHQVVDSQGRPSIEESIDAQYAGTVDMIPKRISENVTRKKLEKLIARFKRMQISDGPGITGQELDSLATRLERELISDEPEVARAKIDWLIDRLERMQKAEEFDESSGWPSF